MKAHDLARLLLERPNGEVTISVDVSEGRQDAGARVFGEFYIGWQPDTNPENTVLMYEGQANFQ